MNDIYELFNAQKLHEICQKYQTWEVTTRLSFKESMIFASQLLMNDKMDDDLRKYSVSLIENIRQVYTKEWDEDWRNEIFLGDAYYLMIDFDKRFEAYKKASKMISPIPAAILVFLAGCYLSPNSALSIDDAERLLIESLHKEKTVEAATLIRGIYKTKNDFNQFSHWDKILNELEDLGAYIDDKWPKFLL